MLNADRAPYEGQIQNAARIAVVPVSPATRRVHQRKRGGGEGWREEGNVCFGYHRNGAGPCDSQTQARISSVHPP